MGGTWEKGESSQTGGTNFTVIPEENVKEMRNRKTSPSRVRVKRDERKGGLEFVLLIGVKEGGRGGDKVDVGGK